MRIKGQIIVKLFYGPSAKNRVSCWLFKVGGRVASRRSRRRWRWP